MLKTTGYQFRQATREDIEDIVTVYIDAFSPGAVWQYAMPEYQKYKDYTRYCLKATFEQAWDNLNTDTASVQVVAVPNRRASDGRNERVVAFGLWMFKGRNCTVTSANAHPSQILQNGLPKWMTQLDTSDPRSNYNCSAGLDRNQTRTADYERQYNAKTRFLDETYPKQLYLAGLATHPDWDGHGFAALNLRWGVEFAKRLQTPATLIATPAGYPLYDDFGFRSVKNITIETLDGWGGGLLWYEAMDML